MLPTENRRILLLDDDPIGLSSLRRSLMPPEPDVSYDIASADLLGTPLPEKTTQSAQFSLTEATQGLEATRLVEQALSAGAPFALAFVDMRLPPGMDGMDTVKQLWQIDPHLQVVICTAYCDHSWGDLAEALGRCDRYVVLRKPFEVIEVRQLAACMTSKWSAANAARQQNQLLKEKVAELEHTSRALKASSALTNKFFAVVAHDLRSPLGGLKRLATLLSARIDTMPAHEAHGMASRVNAAALRLHGKLANLMHWTGLHTGVAQPQPGNIDLHALAQAALSAHTAELARKQVRAQLRIEAPCFARGDAEMTATVFENLISNAVKFSHSNETIELTACVQGSQISVCVTNTGLTIAPQDQDTLFSIEARHTRLGTQGERGTGLGLLLCKELVKQQGGDISACSDAMGQTQVSFTLPAPTPCPAHAAATPAAAPDIHILVVEDDEDERYVTEHQLEELGYTAHYVDDGEQAVAEMTRAQAPRYDLVLMDLYMPVMDGVEATQRLIELMPAPLRPPIICLTGDNTPESRERCLTAGMDGFSRKGLSTQELGDLIAQWVRVSSEREVA